MRAAPAGGGGLLRRLLLLTAAAAAAVPGSAHVAEGGQRAEAAASAMMPTSPARVSLPTLMAGVEGLSAPCQKGVYGVYWVVWFGAWGFGMTADGTYCNVCVYG